MEAGFSLSFYALFLFEPRTQKAKKTSNIQDSTKDRAKSSYKALFPVYFIGFFIMIAYYLAGIEFPHYIEDVLGLEPKYIGLAMASPTLGHGIFAYFCLCNTLVINHFHVLFLFRRCLTGQKWDKT